MWDVRLWWNFWERYPRKVYHVYFMDQNQSTRQKEPLNLRISYLPVNNKIQMRCVCCVGQMAGECFVVWRWRLTHWFTCITSIHTSKLDFWKLFCHFLSTKRVPERVFMDFDHIKNSFWLVECSFTIEIQLFW